MTYLQPMQIQEFLEVAKEASSIGGEVLHKYWGKLSQVGRKGADGDLVTEADQESEEKILRFLRGHFPNHAFLGEESGMHDAGSGGFLWTIDPLDGTTNYTHQYPMVAVSIALLYQQEPVVGVTFNPIMGERFEAGKGLGAYLNGERMRVSSVGVLKESLMITGFAYDKRDTADNNYHEFCHMTLQSQGVRRGGSAALDLAFVAAGRVDAYWERGIKIWDIAAGALLVQEAGGKVSAYDQTPVDLRSGRILASNGVLHDAVSRELRYCKQQRQSQTVDWL